MSEKDPLAFRCKCGAEGHVPGLCKACIEALGDPAAQPAARGVLDNEAPVSPGDEG